MDWETFFEFADDVYGSAVAEEDSSPFVVCPECGEPFFKEDYEGKPICLACGLNFESGEIEEE